MAQWFDGALGHEVIALDLPGDDPDATFDDYAEVVVGGMARASDDVRPVTLFTGKRVATSGIVRPPNERPSEPDSQGRRGWVDEQLAQDYMYADCDSDKTVQAIARLRPQAQTPYFQPCSLAAFPETPATYVVCADDRLVKPDWSARIARERAGADLVELPGSHSPFLSRPAALAHVLHDAALG